MHVQETKDLRESVQETAQAFKDFEAAFRGNRPVMGGNRQQRREKKRRQRLNNDGSKKQFPTMSHK